MGRFEIENDMIHIAFGNAKGFFDVKNLHTGAIYSLEAPVFEIDGELWKAQSPKSVWVDGERNLFNGGKEVKWSCSFEHAKGVQLSVSMQYFPHSPFMRYRYELNAKESACLTKAEGRDRIRYTGFSTNFGKLRLTEIQFSQFNPKVHSYHPHFDVKSEGELIAGGKFPGPVLFVESEHQSWLLAYEHGAQYPDTYLMFHAKVHSGVLDVCIKAEKGNYYDGEIIDGWHSFVSPWFHFAACRGNGKEMLKTYRTFLLKYICEYPESRKPYIFYNTWNYQERNHCFNGKKYLDSMNLERMLKEIDIAHRMSVDVFVIDTGWFNKTGDWQVNLERFPDGLSKVKQKLDQYGMKLGLWMNPIVAAKTSKVCKKYPEYKLTREGKDFCNEIWESEESYWMCLASDYSNLLADKIVEMYKDLGVTYFKWDGIGQYGCDSPYHHHGKENNSSEERLQCYSYKMGMEMIRVVEKVTRQYPDIIVDFDITEEGRFVGLGYLSVGKYFLINNGPYAMDFDLPEKFEAATNKVAINLSPWSNIFFFPGPARSRVCRQGVKYDSFVPSNLFLTHFLPDAPLLSQHNALASMMLGGNGIWGDLLSLGDEDIQLYSDVLSKYKRIAEYVTGSYPIVKGFIGSSPEIYEKIDHEKAKGIICFFTKKKGVYTHVTEEMNIHELSQIDGADYYEVTDDGRLIITVALNEDEARTVFFY